MASRTRQIAEKIKELIAVDFSSGESGLDMQDKVQIGAIIDPPYHPLCVRIVCAGYIRLWAKLGAVPHHQHL